MKLLKNQPIDSPEAGLCSLILSGAFHPDSIIGLAPSNVSMEGEGGVKPARDPRLE
jgi:hypothetical protein